MQPAWRRWVGPELVAAAVRAPSQRSAGVVGPELVDAAAGVRIRVRPRASFATSEPMAAFWLVREGGTGPGTFWFTNGARVVADVRGELGMNPRPLMWTSELFTRLRAAVESRGGSFNRAGVPLEGETVTDDWLRLAIWWAYERESFPTNPLAVDLPPASGLPRVGAELGLEPGRTPQVVNNIEPAQLDPNPWLVQGPNTDVVGNAGGGSTSSGGSGWLLLLAAAAAALTND